MDSEQTAETPLEQLPGYRDTCDASGPEGQCTEPAAIWHQVNGFITAAYCPRHAAAANPLSALLEMKKTMAEDPANQRHVREDGSPNELIP